MSEVEFSDNDFPDWMSFLPEYCLTKKLNELKIPGSYQSNGYQLKKDKGIVINHRNRVDRLKYYLHEVCQLKDLVYSQSITQVNNIYYQLCSGVRYLNIQIAYNRSENKFITVNFFCGDEINVFFLQILAFLHKFRKEIIIIDVSYLHEINGSLLINLISLFKKNLGKYLIPLQSEYPTVNECFTMKKNILLFWPSHSLEVMNTHFWGRDRLNISSVDTENLRELNNVMISGFKNRNESMLVSFFTIQPRFRNLLQTGDSRRKMTEDCLKMLAKTLDKAKKSETHPMNQANIIVFDFVHTCVDDEPLIFKVINLNYKEGFNVDDMIGTINPQF